MTPKSSPSVEADVYGLSYCTTCQKVLADLRRHGVQVRRFRDLKNEPLAFEEVRELAQKVGGAEELFSRRALKYRSLGLDQVALKEGDLLRWMEKEYTFVTRPVVVATHGSAAFCGSSRKALEAWLREASSA